MGASHSIFLVRSREGKEGDLKKKQKEYGEPEGATLNIT